MGFWGKVKGVFGRIGSGVKKGWDWLTGHKEQIKDALDTAQKFIPEDSKFAQKFSGIREKGGQIFDKASDVMDKYGKYL